MTMTSSYLVYDKTTKTEFTVKGNHGKMLKDDLLADRDLAPLPF